MLATTKTALALSLLVSTLAIAGCSSETSSGGAASGKTELPEDTTPITASSAAGLWNLHYEWHSTPPEAWTTYYGSKMAGDIEVAIPSPTQKRGMATANTTWGFAPMGSTIEDGSVKWSFYMNAGNTPFTLDLTGQGTGSALEGTAKFSNASASATWSASKVRTVLLDSERLAGDWTMEFQWPSRTPGELLVTCDKSGSCTIPAGQSGGPKSDDVGVATIEGNELRFEFPDMTQVGVMTSSGTIWGYMDSTGGGPSGVWTATRGKPASESSSSSSGGCTADVDCGSCERCERTTGHCISRLSC